MHSNDIIPTPLTNLPVSRDAIMMLESSDPLITIELSRADVTQLTGAVWSLQGEKGRKSRGRLGAVHCVVSEYVDPTSPLPLPYPLFDCEVPGIPHDDTGVLGASDQVWGFGWHNDAGDGSIMS